MRSCAAGGAPGGDGAEGAHGAGSSAGCQPAAPGLLAAPRSSHRPAGTSPGHCPVHPVHCAKREMFSRQELRQPAAVVTLPHGCRRCALDAQTLSESVPWRYLGADYASEGIVKGCSQLEIWLETRGHAVVQAADFGGGEVAIFSGGDSGAVCRLMLAVPLTPGAGPQDIQVSRTRLQNSFSTLVAAPCTARHAARAAALGRAGS